MSAFDPKRTQAWSTSGPQLAPEISFAATNVIVGVPCLAYGVVSEN